MLEWNVTRFSFPQRVSATSRNVLGSESFTATTRICTAGVLFYKLATLESYILDSCCGVNMHACDLHRLLEETQTFVNRLLLTQGDFNKAEELFRQSLAMQERALGPDHPDVATTLNTLAALLMETVRMFRH